MKLNRRETIILMITLGLAVFFIAYQFVVKPMHEGSVDIDDRLRVDKGRLAKARQMAAQKASIDARYKNLVGFIGVAGSEEAQIPAMISRIEAAARESNIHIANIQPQKPAAQKEVVFLAVELQIDGQWPDIVRFLHSLQQQPDFYFVNGLNLEKYSDATNSLRGRIVISRMCLVDRLPSR